MYVRITAKLRQRVVKGVYPIGARIPSEASLCKEFGVTRGTVRRALDTLQDEGLIRVQVGVGRFVRRPGERSTDQAEARYQRIAADLRAGIHRGDYLPGSWLPGELRIAARYGVSRYTAQRALTELEKARLVECLHGRGRFVLRKTSLDDPSAPVDVR
ncbi:GntR family transcriptional regulator [Actinomadura sp. 21ATH]|uniref:GntR family transcriptional regulator n=1 Tax=Actinomadura sp. 21ATH TaxID=1735444 RepID=UPI0035C16C86